MPRTPNNPFEILDPLKRNVRVDPRLEGAAYHRHTKPVVLPASPLSPQWLQVAQQIIHMQPMQKKAVGREKMKLICTQALQALHDQKVRGKGYDKLKRELLRVRKVWG